MRHRLSLLLVLLLLPLASGTPAQPVGGQSQNTSPYYPLKVGTTWHYRAGDQTIMVKVVGTEKVGMLTCAKVEATEKGITRVEYIAIQPDGLYRTKIKDKELKPALCFLKLPPVNQTIWKVESVVDGTRMRGTFTIDTEEVIVPAGKFETIKVTSQDFFIGSRSVAMTYWFAKDKGIVKQRLAVAGFELVLELEKFEPGQ